MYLSFHQADRFFSFMEHSIVFPVSLQDTASRTDLFIYWGNPMQLPQNSKGSGTAGQQMGRLRW
jgi:hypothetical protein